MAYSTSTTVVPGDKFIGDEVSTPGSAAGITVVLVSGSDPAVQVGRAGVEVAVGLEMTGW